MVGRYYALISMGSDFMTGAFKHKCLVIDDKLQIGNLFSFPKHPFKSRSSLEIIEIIGLKHKQYHPKTTTTVIELRSGA